MSRIGRFLARFAKCIEYVGLEQAPQRTRYVLFRRRWLQIVVHHHHRGDTPFLHDHGFHNVTVVLSGSFREMYPLSRGRADHGVACVAVPSVAGRQRHETFAYAVRVPGDVILRHAMTRHWISIEEGDEVWTLFVTGRERRPWGYVVRDQWIEARLAVEVHNADLAAACRAHVRKLQESKA